MEIESRNSIYLQNKKSKVGSMITCPVCGKRFFNQRGKIETLKYLKSLNKFQGLKSTALYFDTHIGGEDVNRR